MTNKVYAVTGGIGSGKSTVSKIIKDCGYEVFSADNVYKELLKCPDFIKSIYSALSIENADILNFDAKLVSNKVFNDKELLKKLNEATHPKIMQKLIEKSKSVSGVCFNEVPLLFEGGYENLYDGVIVVKRDFKLRESDVIKRDNISKEEFLKRVNNQFDYQKLDNTHTVITNDGNLKELEVKVKAVLSEIIEG